MHTEDTQGPRAKPFLPAQLLGLLAVPLLAGALSTSLWIGSTQFPLLRGQLFSGAVLASALVCVALTSVNLMTRWLRWHFLVRCFTPQLVTRDSLAVYVATLPAIMSPFFVGELARVWLLRKRFRAPASCLVRIWIAERSLDVGVLATGLAWTFGWHWGLLATGALLACAQLLLARVLRGRPPRELVGVMLASVSATAFAWALPVVALHLSLRFLGSWSGAVAALRAFTASTLAGGITGLPLGVFVTGSAMIRELVGDGVSTPVAVLAILVYRAGTAWFAVLLGFTSWVVLRARLVRLLRGGEDCHFDELAAEYAAEIAPHVRDRMLERKVALMLGMLSRQGIARGARGLDLGCGQGWYLQRMQASGYRIDGTDYSAGQLARARELLARDGASLPDLFQADACALPCESGTYDFVYCINALHHILGPGAQLRALREVVRVLKPGGVLLLHEINTQNPLFRWYMGYLFPLLKRIDEGTEEWLPPLALPALAGAQWHQEHLRYFTFLPDFIPSRLLVLFAGLERWLERSRFRSFSAHYQACLVKDGAAAAADIGAPREQETRLATDAPAASGSLPPRTPSTSASNRWRALWNGPAPARRGAVSWHAAWAALLRTCCCGLVAALLLANFNGRPHVDLYPSYVAAKLANEAQWHHIYHDLVWIEHGVDPEWDRRAAELVTAPIGTTSFVYHPWYLSALRAVVNQLDYRAFQGLSIALSEASIALIGLGLALLLRWKTLPQQLLLTFIVTAASSTQYSLMLGQNTLPALALALAAALCWQGGAPLLLGGMFAALAWTCKPWCGSLLALCFLSRGIRAGLSTTALLVAVMVVLPEFVLPSVLMHDYHAMNRALAKSFVWGQNNLSVLSIIERATAPDWSKHLHDWAPVAPPALHRAAALGASALILAAGASLWWRKQPRPEWTTAAWLAFMLVPLGITWDHYFVFAFPLAALATFSDGVPLLVRASGLALSAMLTALVPLYSISIEQAHAYLTHPAGLPWLRAIPMTLLVASLLLGLRFGGHRASTPAAREVPHSRYAPRVCRLANRSLEQGDGS